MTLIVIFTAFVGLSALYFWERDLFWLKKYKKKYIKGTVCLRPQIAKANRGGRSYTQSVVKPVIIKLQQYNDIRLNTTMLN